MDFDGDADAMVAAYRSGKTVDLLIARRHLSGQAVCDGYRLLFLIRQDVEPPADNRAGQDHEASNAHRRVCDQPQSAQRDA